MDDLGNVGWAANCVGEHYNFNIAIIVKILIEIL